MNYYHIYNRGAHKALVFHDKYDYERMLKLFYIANCSESFLLRKFNRSNIYDVERKDSLVNIVAYCLMPNHFHIAIKMDEHMSDICITKFMRKVLSGYSNYYNLKYKHSGTIWQGSYKMKVSVDFLYFDRLITYIHLNPYTASQDSDNYILKKEFSEQAWISSKQYQYSSLMDYCGQVRSQSKIIKYQPGVRVCGDADV